MTIEQITAMSVTFDAAEDRIRLDCKLDAERTTCLWLTRRIARRMLENLGIWLGRSSAVAQSISQPELRDQALQMEHTRLRQAVAERNQDTPSIKSIPSSDGRLGQVITGARFGEDPNQILVVAFLVDRLAHPSFQIRFDRAQLHWLTGRLDQLAGNAAWDLGEGERGWLGAASTVPANSGPLH